tara:strand:+ start:1947 stop:2471 length:525 start_codon:yes stop_codon:yes gene_type:complete
MKNRLLSFVLKSEFLYFLFCKYYFNNYEFKKINEIQIDADWGKFLSLYKLRLSPDNLIALLNSPNGYLPIPVVESPHYKMIDKYSKFNQIDSDEYIKYFNTYNEGDKKNLQIKKYIKLYESIKKDPNRLFVCIKKESDSFFTNKFKIIDGLHRAAIAKTLNIEKVDCYIVDSIN